MRSLVAVVVILITAGTVHAQTERTDLTPGLKTHMERHFLGFRANDGPTVIERHRPGGLGGVRPPGWEDRAKGHAEIDRLDAMEGKIERIRIPDIDLTVVTGDVKMVWHYTGQTSCERISSPGGAVIDHPWRDLHPTGNITITLRVEKQKNGKLRKEMVIEGGHGDRPNNYLRDHIAPKLAKKAEELLEANLGVDIDQD